LLAALTAGFCLVPGVGCRSQSNGGGGRPSPDAAAGGAGMAGGGAGGTNATGGSSGGAGAPGSGGSTTGGGGRGGGGGGAAGGAVGGGGTGGSSVSPDGGPAQDGGGAGTLRIYWIDVEGGAATLLVAPNGETVMVDAGFPGNGDRDLNRILAVLQTEVGATRIDHLITTHYHTDHVGGVAPLANRFPVGRFIDHGPTVEAAAPFTSYMNAIGTRTRVIVKPGDRMQLGDLELVFVTAHGQVIEPALVASGPNPFCTGATVKPGSTTDENPMSVGFVARFGKFDFLDLGDLTWAVEHQLVCPSNRVGPIDLYQVNHHGLDSSGSPQFVHAIAPTVAVMNNGATKGGAASTFETLKASPGIRDIWQLHRSMNNDAQHNTEEALMANPAASPDAGHFIKASVDRDGNFTITNGRTGLSRTYPSR
jgi:beta-lactamase superfamily II metal-dependent hydrolase